MATNISAQSSAQLMKGDTSRSKVADDIEELVKQIKATHDPHGQEVNVKPLLLLVEDILHATPNVNSIVPATKAADIKKMEDKPMSDAVLSSKIYQISCKISCPCLSDGDAQAPMVSLFKMLSSYSWDAKLVLTLAAFAPNYGEFCLLSQLYSSNQLAKSMATLKQLPVVMEHYSGLLKPRFDALNNLIKVILDVTRCIVELKELLNKNIITEYLQAFSDATANIPTAVIWTIKSVVACTTQITSITPISHEGGSTAEARELSTLAQILNKIHGHLKNQLAICNKHIEEKENAEAFQNLKNLFSIDMIHIDNMKILKALICDKDDLYPLFDGSAKKRVNYNIDVLRRKNVLLLISDPNISDDELSILEQSYNDQTKIHTTGVENHYEVVWIPIVDSWTDPMLKEFESKPSKHPWYTVYPPTLIGQTVIKFIKEVWHFRNKPILVVLDPQGKVVCPNAIHMMRIWGSKAFPFTSSREEALWREETWKLELLVNGIDPTIPNWIGEEKYIFLYGGDDIMWIQNITATARAFAKNAGIHLEMVYMEKWSKREQIRKDIESIIVKHSVKSISQDKISLFWARLEGMLFSKIQQGQADDKDPIMQEIKKLFSYHKARAWAVLSKGSDVLINGHGTAVLNTLLKYNSSGPVPAKDLNSWITELYIKLHRFNLPCCRFEFLSTAERIPDTMKCPECPNHMEKFVSFRCCHEESAINGLH